MKRNFTLIIGVFAVAALALWSQRASAQLESEPMSYEPIAAFFMDDPPEADDHQIKHHQGAHHAHIFPDHPVGGGHGGRMDGAFPPGVIEELELTDQQQAKLKSLRTAFAKDMAKLRADAEIARIELREVMSGVNPAAADARVKAAAVNTARAKVFERTVVFQVETKNVLTADQQKKLQDEGPRMMRGRRSGMMERPGSDRAFGGSMMHRQGPPPAPER